MSTLRSNKSKSVNPILKYSTDLKNSDKSASIKHSHISLRPFLLLQTILCKNYLLSVGKENLAAANLITYNKTLNAVLPHLQ